MTDTLDMFQREWYRLSGEGKISDSDLGTVPDIYLRNQQLSDELQVMRTELGRMQDVAHKAKSTWDKFRKERDFHKMHHKRVVQEKNKLIVDLKRLCAARRRRTRPDVQAARITPAHRYHVAPRCAQEEPLLEL